MKSLAAWLTGCVLLPACCVFTKGNVNVADPAKGLTLVERLEAETPALVWWNDGEGHHTYNSEEATNAYRFVPYCGAVWLTADTMLTAEHCVDDIGRPAKTVTEDTDDDDGDDETDGPIQELQELLQQVQELKDQMTAWTPVGQTVLYSNRADIDPQHNNYHTGKVFAVDMLNDLALIKADGPDSHPVANLRVGPIHDGEELHIIGNPAGGWWTYEHGYVAAERPQYWDGKHWRPVTQVSAPVFFGNSGGGAYDASGNLIGIADAVNPKIPETAFFVPRDVIRGFLTANRVP